MRLETLATAIMNAHLEKNQEMGLKTATEVAETVLAHFGYGNFCLGNHLMQDEREVFYELEELGLLSSRTGMDFLYTGKDWRTFEWQLNEVRIRQLQHVVFVQEVRPEELIYEGMPESAFIPGAEMKEEDIRVAIRPEVQKKYVMVQKAVAEDSEDAPVVIRNTTEKVKELIQQGKTNAEISRELGVSAATITYHAKKIKLKRPPGRKPAATVEKIRELLRKGMTPAEIAKELVITRKALSKYITKINKLDGTPGKVWTKKTEEEALEPQLETDELLEILKRENKALADENLKLKNSESSGIEIRIRVPEDFLKTILGKLEVGN